MQINIPAVEIQTKVTTALDNARKSLELAKTALSKCNEKLLIEEVERQNSIWWRKLLKQFVTTETVVLPLWFSMDASLSVPARVVDSIEKNVEILQNLQSSLIGVNFTCMVLINEKEMNLINRYQF